MPRQLNINIDPTRLTAFNISAGAVTSALRAANKDLAAGAITQDSLVQSIQVLGQIRDQEDFYDIIVGNQGGQPVYLRDVATIEDGDGEAATLARRLRNLDRPLSGVVAAIEALIDERSETSFVLTSDHAAELGEFSVPFVVVSDRLPEGERIGTRLGATYDLPQTVLGLLGSPRRFCHQGRNLVGAEEFPGRRVAFSQIGDGSHRFVLFEGRNHGEELLRWEIDSTNPLAEETPATLHDLVADPGRKSDLFSRRDPDWPQIDEFWRSHLGIGIYLLRTNRFVPAAEVASPEVPQPLVKNLFVPFTSVEVLPAAPGRYFVPARALEKASSLGEVLASHKRGTTVVVDLRSSTFDSFDALERWLGKDVAKVDGLLFDDVGMAVGWAERSKSPVGVWITPRMGDQGVLFDQIAQAGIDFVVMPIPTETGVRRAKQRGLEVWVPKSGLELLSDVEPNVVFE